MKVAILGAGRLGTALALRSLARGHETRVLARSPERAHSALRALTELVDLASFDGEALILLAAPAYADTDAEASLATFLDRAPGVPVASAVAYPAAPHELWAQGRSYTRFLCSPAIADAHHAAVLVLTPATGAATDLLLDWCGPSTVAAGDANAFHRNGALLMTTTLHLALLDMIEQRGAPQAGDARIIHAALDDVSVLLRCAQEDAALALDRCATPKGETLRLTDAYRETLHNFIKGLDIDGRAH